MSPEPTEGHTAPGHAAESSQRQRFGLLLTVGLGLIAGGFSYFGTRDAWLTADRRPESSVVANSGVPADPAWDLELPDGPHRDEFQSSCLVCHSARLPFNQPAFHREKWVEIVHKMVDAYGAPMTPEDESHVVDYLVAVRPSGP
jgi:hypothetical protein